jgi:hypothetical protein
MVLSSAQASSPPAQTSLSRAKAHVERLAEPERPPHLDAVLDVHEPHGREREAAVGHQPHMEREGEHVRIRGRQLITQAEPAHARIFRDLR